jgi:NADH-quinone oxidoreductase subunit L
MTFWGWPVATLVTLFLFVGAAGKSAQIPLYVWLPDAMAGPTPVSALIHAATMVTAGVYMIGRTNVLFSMAPFTLGVVAVIGLATALFAATIGTAQNDIKKVLAYSTVSQLGFMFLAMGVGAYAAGIFHLMTHAFFKACLFLGSGSVIHAMGGEQDMRKMGGLRKYLPATSTTFIVATLAIAGIPPFAGFFSKDEILWQAFSSPHGSPFLHMGGLVAAGFTAFYMFRQVFMVFFGEFRGDEHTKHHLHESPPSMTIPLWILMGGAVFAGLLWIPNVFTPFEHWLEPVMAMHPDVAPQLAAAHEGHQDFMLELGLMALSVGIAGVGITVAYLMYYRRAIDPDRVSNLAGGAIYRTVHNKYYVDELYELIFVRGVGIGTARILAWFDANVIDGVVNGAAAVGRGVGWFIGLFDNGVVDGAVNGVADGAYVAGRSLRRLQSGAITAYIYVIAVGVLGGVLLYWSIAVAS